jgi:hypothetical protein
MREVDWIGVGWFQTGFRVCLTRAVEVFTISEGLVVPKQDVFRVSSACPVAAPVPSDAAI